MCCVSVTDHAVDIYKFKSNHISSETTLNVDNAMHVALSTFNVVSEKYCCTDNVQLFLSFPFSLFDLKISG